MEVEEGGGGGDATRSVPVMEVTSLATPPMRQMHDTVANGIPPSRSSLALSVLHYPVPW